MLILFTYTKKIPVKYYFTGIYLLIEAERQGFEPRVPRSTTVFKTAAIDHSATSPEPLYQKCFSLKAVQRYNSFFDTQIFLGQNLRKIKIGWKIMPAE